MGTVNFQMIRLVLFIYLFFKLVLEKAEEPYKKDLHDPYNHNGVITHLEPDIQESKVKWALRSITDQS